MTRLIKTAFVLVLCVVFNINLNVVASPSVSSHSNLIATCKTGELPCLDGRCVKELMDCINFILNNTSNNDTSNSDTLCKWDEIRCDNGSCVKDIEDCLKYCPSGWVRCSPETCAPTDDDCPACASNEKLCGSKCIAESEGCEFFEGKPDDKAWIWLIIRAIVGIVFTGVFIAVILMYLRRRRQRQRQRGAGVGLSVAGTAPPPNALQTAYPTYPSTYPTNPPAYQQTYQPPPNAAGFTYSAPPTQS